MKLISEQIEEVNFISESIDGKKNYFIEGIFLQGEIKNRNGRMYPMSVLDREVEKYSEGYIKTDRALGELGHPDGPNLNLDRVSHKIQSLNKEGTNYVGRAKILSTPMGQIAKNLLDEGIKLGVSSRGMGSIKKESNCSVVCDDFMLATAADIVADPSAPDAFVEGIMEGKEWIWDGGILRENIAAKTYKEINTLVTQRQLDEKKLDLFNNFLNNL